MKSLLAVALREKQRGSRRMCEEDGEQEGKRRGGPAGASGGRQLSGRGWRLPERGEHVSRDGDGGCREVEQGSGRQGRSELKRGPGNQDDTSDPKRGRVLTVSPHGLFA